MSKTSSKAKICVMESAGVFSRVSVIIPSPSEMEIPEVLASLRRGGFPAERMEVLLAVGENPPEQRNKAAARAKGEIIYFMNRDTQVLPGLFDRILERFNADSNLAAAGGPDLSPPQSTALQNFISQTLASPFAHWKMSARYAKKGGDRSTDEKELILSNLALRWDLFLEFGGFNTSLYPNEENELLNRLRKGGWKLLYSPDLGIERVRRASLKSFVHQFFRYGSGRMRQIREEGLGGNFPFLLPLLLLISMLSSVFGAFLFPAILLYALLCVADSARAAVQTGKPLCLLALPPLYLLMHLSYAAGMLKSLPSLLMPKKPKRKFTETSDDIEVTVCNETL